LVAVAVAEEPIILVRQSALLEMAMEPQSEMQGSTHLELVQAPQADN
jgi:hypothetical protein